MSGQDKTVRCVAETIETSSNRNKLKDGVIIMSEKATKEKNSIILKIEQLVTQEVAGGGIRKYLGYINAKGVLDLLSVSELEANPRRPKINSATEAIQETLGKTPELMSCKSKGLLISCSVVEELERNRLRLSFDPDYRNFEDVLDGGHNLFAISCFIIEQLLADDESLLPKAQKIKEWSDLKVFWSENHDIIYSALSNNGVEFSFMVPVEIITVPEITEESLTRFTSSIFDISQARNNNAQLSNLASDNQKGIFNVVKENLPAYLKEIVAWTTGDSSKVVKGEYVLALVSFIFTSLQSHGKCPLLLKDFHVTMTGFYSGRGKCAEQVQNVLTLWKERYDANNLDPECMVLKESLALLNDMPRVWDAIEFAFPALYNKFGGSPGKKGAYGRLSPFAKKANKGKDATLRKDTLCRFHTPDYVQKAGTYATQDGYTAPLEYTIMAFMTFNEAAGRLEWKRPVSEIVAFYTDTSDEAAIGPTMNQLGDLIVSAVRGDPQALGKASFAYKAIMLSVQAAIAAI